MRLLRVVCAGALVIYMMTLWRLAYLEAGGAPHIDFQLKGGIPATLYMPPGENPNDRIEPLPPGARPPAVLLIHGFSFDRAMMSTLARRIANAGYGVLAIDVRGHGDNRNPFASSSAIGAGLDGDVNAAIDFLRATPGVDGSRIVIIGHSMGAAASLDHATADPDLKGVVLISGGMQLVGSVRPHDALFIFAARDPEQIKDSSKSIAARLAGVDAVEAGKVYGNFAAGDAVRAIEIANTDHVSIIFSPAAAQTMIEWLDGVFATKRIAPLNLRQPRINAGAVAIAAFLVLLTGLGRITGRLAPQWHRDAAGGWLGLGGLALALASVMPLVATHPPAFFVSLAVGDVVISWLGLAGGVMLVFALRNRLGWERVGEHLGTTLLAALAAFAAIYAMLVPIGAVFHRLTPTPERLLATVLCSILLLPFFLAFEMIVRRGSVATSTIRGVVGRAIILALLAIGVNIHLLPFVMILVLPSLAMVLVFFEVFAASAYSASGNLLTIALVESAWLGWFTAAIMPITFMF